MPPVRRLAAILAADVAGYSRLMGVDEEGTHERLKAHLAELVNPEIAERRGRIVKNTGDGFLAEFASVVDAVRCAAEVQRGMAERNAHAPAEERIEFRIGINLGDVIVEEHDIFGDGVNVAARLEALAEPGGICVSRVVRDQVQDRLDYAFEDLGEQSLKNIARPVRIYRAQPASAPALSVPAATAFVPPDKPSIAVLPFRNMSGDPEQEYFVDGMVEEIITALSRIRSLFVIARNSSFTYKGQAVDVKRVGRELGVRYVLEGSARKGGNRVRITAQLIDAVTGTHLWADRFDGLIEDVFELQDKVTTSVAASIEPKVRVAEIERALLKPTENLEAYDLVLRGRWAYGGQQRNPYEETAHLCRRAIALDPNYALAYALLARALWVRVAHQWVKPSQDELTECVNFARTAVRLGHAEPEVLAIAAQIIALPGGELKEGIAITDQALAQNPNSVDALATSGMLRAYVGDTERAFRHLQEAERLRPPGVRIFNKSFGLALAYFVDGDYARVLDWTAQDMRERSNNIVALRYRAAALGLLGRLDEARQTVDQLLAANPEMTISRCRRLVELVMKNPFKRVGVVEAYYEGLRRAGLPE